MNLKNKEVVSDIETGSILHSAAIAGMGGILPTLSAIAGAAVSDPEKVDLISPGHFTAMILYFIVGFILCFGLRERRLKESFILGIAAPAIIMNLISGATSTTQNQDVVWNLSLIPVAYAQASQIKESKPSKFIHDLKRGLGFNVEFESIKSEYHITQSQLKEVSKRNIVLVNEIYKLSSELSSNEKNDSCSEKTDISNNSKPDESQSLITNTLEKEKFKTNENINEYQFYAFNSNSKLADIVILHQLETALYQSGLLNEYRDIHNLKMALISSLNLDYSVYAILAKNLNDEKTLMMLMKVKKSDPKIGHLMSEITNIDESFYSPECYNSYDIARIIDLQAKFSRELYSHAFAKDGTRQNQDTRMSERDRLLQLHFIYKEKLR